MKRTIIAFTGLVAMFSLLWIGVAHATNVRSGDTPTVASGETVNGTLFTGGQTIKIMGTVEGDVFCAGMNVDISGTVEGDVICAAQNLNISGHITGNIRVAGQNVLVSGKVDNSATIGGMSVETKNSAVIGRDLTLGGQTVTLDGEVKRDVLAGSQSFSDSAKIGRNLDVDAVSVNLQNTATIGGNFSYTSSANANINGATIIGATDHKYPQNTQKQAVNTTAIYTATVALSLLSFIVIGFVLQGVSPRLMALAPNAIKTAPLSTLGLGVVSVIVLPIFAVLLFMTIVGGWLAFVIMLAWVIAIIIGTTFTGKAIGDLILQKLSWSDNLKAFTSIILGLFLLFLVGIIPVAGPIVMIFASIWGSGALLYIIGKNRQSDGAAIQPESKGKGGKKKVYL